MRKVNDALLYHWVLKCEMEKTFGCFTMTCNTTKRWAPIARTLWTIVWHAWKKNRSENAFCVAKWPNHLTVFDEIILLTISTWSVYKEEDDEEEDEEEAVFAPMDDTESDNKTNLTWKTNKATTRHSVLNKMIWLWSCQHLNRTRVLRNNLSWSLTPLSVSSVLKLLGELGQHLSFWMKWQHENAIKTPTTSLSR
jgi:hypothetical protein